MASVLTRSAIVAPKNFNRWLIPPAALAIHLCIGQVYAFSVFKIPFMSHFDAGEVSIGWIFSIAILMLGISSAIFGPWVEKNGPRASMVAAGTCWVIGFFVASLGIMTGQLWLVYLGYGVIGGIGLGIGYISPVSTLMKWFPDRPGLATGLAIMGFGGGALIASPMSNQLMSLYGGGPEPENLVAGLTPTFVTLGIVYAVVIAAGAFVIRVPHPEWTPKNFDPAKATTKPMQTTGNVSVRNAIRTPQFWLLWVRPLPQRHCRHRHPRERGPDDPVLLRHHGGSCRRLRGAAVDRQHGRPLHLVDNLGLPGPEEQLHDVPRRRAAALPDRRTLRRQAPSSSSSSRRWSSSRSTAADSRPFPAYLKDLFGVYQVGAIHGALLTAWSAAGVAGPLIVNSVVEAGEKAGKTGPELYTPGMYIMVGVLAIGFIANVLVRPVSERFFEREEDVKAKQAAALEDDN